jgi:hypothetical protein
MNPFRIRTKKKTSTSSQSQKKSSHSALLVFSMAELLLLEFLLTNMISFDPFQDIFNCFVLFYIFLENRNCFVIFKINKKIFFALQPCTVYPFETAVCCFASLLITRLAVSNYISKEKHLQKLQKTSFVRIRKQIISFFLFYISVNFE